MEGSCPGKSEFAVFAQVRHHQIIHCHHCGIFAHIISVGCSAAQNKVCAVQLRIAQILRDDQDPASAVLDRIPNLCIAAHIGAAHGADDGKAVRAKMLRAFQLRIIGHELLHILSHDHHLALEEPSDVPQKVMGKICHMVAVVDIPDDVRHNFHVLRADPRFTILPP